MTELQKYLKMFDLKATADLAILKTAYRKMVRDWHPDLIQNNDGMKKLAEEKIKEINIAYEYLYGFFSRKAAGTPSDDDHDALEPITCRVLEKDTYQINLDQERIFPVLFESFFNFGLINISWNSYEKIFYAIHQEGSFDKSQNKDIQVAITERSGESLVKVSFKFSHHSQNVKLGFIQGPDLSKPIIRLLGSTRFKKELRPTLLPVFFQNFQLHEITVSEILNKNILVRQAEDFLELQAISINQLMTLLYVSFFDCGVQNISWNTFDQNIVGTTGWSIRSCGQKVSAQIEGAGKQYVARIRSEPLAFGEGGQTRKTGDLGRGKDEVNRIIANVVRRIKP